MLGFTQVIPNRLSVESSHPSLAQGRHPRDESSELQSTQSSLQEIRLVYGYIGNGETVRKSKGQGGFCSFNDFNVRKLYNTHYSHTVQCILADRNRVQCTLYTVIVPCSSLSNVHFV